MDVAPIPSLPEPLSLADRLTAVITAPGEAFDDIKDTPVHASNWLVPLILSCIATIIYIIMAFSQPAILSSMQEQREHAMQKKVAAHKMTQAQADQISAMTEKFMTPTLLKIFGVGGAIFGCTAGLFLIALAIWLGLKCCTVARPAYMKVVEVCGLALIIDVLQKIIRSWLVWWKENFLATASPTLFVTNPSPTNQLHVFLSLFDVVDIWWLAVLSIGISKIASVRFRTAAIITFGVWYGFRIIAALWALLQA